MSNEAIKQPVNEQGYQMLGKKVLWLFFLQASPAGFILLAITLVFFILSYQPFMIDTFWGDLQKASLLATLITFLLSIVTLAGSLSLAWMNYASYLFLMAEDSLKIKRGIFNKTVNAIPYRQIQNVDIERGFLFQMLGLSRLVILTAGHEDINPKTANTDESEGVIPALDQKLAEWLQTELLKRANIEKTIQVNATPGQN